MKKGRKKVLFGWRYESLDEKIRYMLSLSPGERYTLGLAKGYLAKLLERNQYKIYGRRGFKSIQILKSKSR
jgi:hypothetical protein